MEAAYLVHDSASTLLPSPPTCRSSSQQNCQTPETRVLIATKCNVKRRDSIVNVLVVLSSGGAGDGAPDIAKDSVLSQPHTDTIFWILKSHSKLWPAPVTLRLRTQPAEVTGDPGSHMARSVPVSRVLESGPTSLMFHLTAFQNVHECPREEMQEWRQLSLFFTFRS